MVVDENWVVPFSFVLRRRINSVHSVVVDEIFGL
jgi:hypothetical protein